MFSDIGLIVKKSFKFSANLFSKLNDTFDVFSCHRVGGMLGMVLTGIFAAEVGSYFLCIITNTIVPMRVTPEQELEGLDLSKHGEKI